jgi:hypothetical protein
LLWCGFVFVLRCKHHICLIVFLPLRCIRFRSILGYFLYLNRRNRLFWVRTRIVFLCCICVLFDIRLEWIRSLCLGMVWRKICVRLVLGISLCSLLRFCHSQLDRKVEFLYWG